MVGRRWGKLMHAELFRGGSGAYGKGVSVAVLVVHASWPCMRRSIGVSSLLLRGERLSFAFPRGGGLVLASSCLLSCLASR